MRKALPAAWLLCLVAVPPAYSNEAEATACAEMLQPQARLVFNAVSEQPTSSEPLRRVMAARVRELVFTDRLTRSAARPAAEAASECLRISRGCTAEIC